MEIQKSEQSLTKILSGKFTKTGDAVKTTQVSVINKNKPQELLAVMMKLLQELNKHIKSTVFDSPDSLREVAQLIISEFWYLRIGEIKLVLDRLKTGYYGESYGAIDTPKICHCLREYDNSERVAYFERENHNQKPDLKEPLEKIDYEAYKEKIKNDLKTSKEKIKSDEDFKKFRTKYLTKKKK